VGRKEPQLEGQRRRRLPSPVFAVLCIALAVLCATTGGSANVSAQQSQPGGACEPEFPALVARAIALREGEDPGAQVPSEEADLYSVAIVVDDFNRELSSLPAKSGVPALLLELTSSQVLELRDRREITPEVCEIVRYMLASYYEPAQKDEPEQKEGGSSNEVARPTEVSDSLPAVSSRPRTEREPERPRLQARRTELPGAATKRAIPAASPPEQVVNSPEPAVRSVERWNVVSPERSPKVPAASRDTVQPRKQPTPDPSPSWGDSDLWTPTPAQPEVGEVALGSQESVARVRVPPSKPDFPGDLLERDPVQRDLEDAADVPPSIGTGGAPLGRGRTRRERLDGVGTSGARNIALEAERIGSEIDRLLEVPVYLTLRDLRVRKLRISVMELQERRDAALRARAELLQILEGLSRDREVRGALAELLGSARIEEVRVGIQRSFADQEASSDRDRALRLWKQVGQ